MARSGRQQAQGGQDGWQILLAHLNRGRPAVQRLAVWLQANEPDLEEPQARKIAEKVRKGQAIGGRDLAGLPDAQAAELAELLETVRSAYRSQDSVRGQADRELERLRLEIPLQERDRLKALREMGNGKALSPADLKLAQLRSPESIAAWLAMGRAAKLAWFARVEAALQLRDKRRLHDQAPWIDATYRRLYLSPRREVVTLSDYEILGIPVEADEATIKRAYRDAAKIHHPDANGDERRFKQVHAAYQRLIGET